MTPNYEGNPTPFLLHEAEETFALQCSHKENGIRCPKDAHPQSESAECAAHTRDGWLDVLQGDRYDMILQSEFAKWVAICIAEEVAKLGVQR